VLDVQVALTDGESNPIESGAAVENPVDSGRWVYTATTAVETGTTVRPSTLLSVAGQASPSQPKTGQAAWARRKGRRHSKSIQGQGNLDLHGWGCPPPSFP